MRNIHKLFFALVITLLVVVGFSTTTSKAEAFEVRQDKNVTKDEVITGDLFISGEIIKVDGTVNGNLFVGGQTVNISGDVNGNVFVGASDVIITGDVSKSVYAGAGTITISGNVGRDVFLGAGQATLNGKVGEDAFLGAGTVSINDMIVNNLYAGAGQISLLGTVGKDAFISTSSADVPKVKVMGQLQLRIEDTKKQDTQIKKNTDELLWGGMTVFKIIFGGAMFIGMYLLGLVIVKYLPVFMTKLNREMSESFAKDFGVGLLVLCAAPLVIFMLAITIVGMPFAFVFFAGLVAVAFLNSIVMGEFVGKNIFRMMDKKVNYALELFVGMLLVTILFSVPIVGFFAKVFSYSVVLGAFIFQKMNAVKK